MLTFINSVTYYILLKKSVIFFCDKLLATIRSIALSNLLTSLGNDITFFFIHFRLLEKLTQSCHKRFCFFRRYDRNLCLLFFVIIIRIVLIGRSRLYNFLVSKSTSSCDIIIKVNKFFKWYRNLKSVPRAQQTSNLLTLYRNYSADVLFILKKTASSEAIRDGLRVGTSTSIELHF